MAISNEERRWVAARLRNKLQYMRKNEMYEDDLDALLCGNTAYRNIAAAVEENGNLVSGNYIRIVERLADLIEPPTCTVRMGATGHVGVCMRCGAMVSRTRYCPNCGAEAWCDED